MLNHTRRIVPMMRAITSDRADVTVTVKRRRAHGKVTYLATYTTWEMNGRGERRAPIMTGHLASWCPTTGELFADDGDRVSGGHWDTYRETARANRRALDAIAAYGAQHGHVLQRHGMTVRQHHYRIAIPGTLSALLAGTAPDGRPYAL